MESFFEKNITTLKQRFGKFEIKNHWKNTIEVHKTPSGFVTARHETVFLHSSYDPVKEATSLAKKVKSGDRICLYGLGLGYHAEAILDRIGPEGRLILIELNPDILSAALTLRNLTPLISDLRMFLITGTSEIEVATLMARRMDSTQTEANEENLEVMFHLPSFKCIPKGFEQITNALEILQIERRVPAIFGGLEQQNRELNDKIVQNSRGLRSLHLTNSGKPAFMISAGPSLDDALPFLSTIKKKAIIACVDTACPILLSRGIHPDYVFSLDPQDESFIFFQRYLDRVLNLICVPTANAKVLQFVTGEKFIAFKEGKITKRDEKISEQKGITQAGGSVACLGIDSLIQMGCCPIILVGQDCAFTGRRVYSRFSCAEEELTFHLGPTQTLAQAYWEKYNKRKQVSISCYGTGKTTTDQILYGYLRNIEQLAEANPETRFYNLFPHGAKINRVSPLGSINETLKILGEVRS